MSQSKTVEDLTWISGSDARRILGWESTDSVRVAAQSRGKFAWRKKPNGRIEYLCRDVEEYRDQRAEAMAASAARAPKVVEAESEAPPPQ